jgi:hypothetical protein
MEAFAAGRGRAAPLLAQRKDRRFASSCICRANGYMAIHNSMFPTHPGYVRAFKCSHRQTPSVLAAGNGICPSRSPVLAETFIYFARSMTMKLFRILAVAAVLATPFASFAQSNAPVTRESVRAELVQLQKAGYNLASDQTQYPSNIQAASARVYAQDRAAMDSYGPSTAGTSVAGAAGIPGFDSVYARP